MSDPLQRSPEETPAQYAERMRQMVTIIVSRVRAEMGDPGYDLDAIIDELEALAAGEAYFIFKDRLRSALTEATEQLGFNEAWAIVGPWMMRERASRADPTEAMRLLENFGTEPPAPGDEMPYKDADMSVLEGLEAKRKRPVGHVEDKPRLTTVHDILMAWYRRDITNADAHQLLELDDDESVEEVAKDNDIFGWGWLPGDPDGKNRRS